MHCTRLASALALATVAVGAAAAPARAADLSISPALIERTATPGALGAVRVTNGSSKTIDIAVRARPWIQSRAGASRPDDSRQLRQIRITGSTFKLAPGASRSVPLALVSRPTSGSLYGAVSVLGTPEGAKPKNGVTTRYRLLAALRLNPPAASQRFKVSVGSARYRAGVTLLTVRNRGNTVEPITGSATVTGPTGTRRATFTATRVLPNAAVDLRLPQGKLAKGKYTVAVKLTQAGHAVGSLKRTITVK